MIGNDIFLTAEWRKLILANYAVDSAILAPYLPKHTQLDAFEGKHYVSLVGFLFANTKLRGYKIPFHGNFQEVNLRFYVKHFDGTNWKRGVVFIKEIVPKPAITFVANTIYRENYQTLRMKHSWDIGEQNMDISYSWKNQGWHSISVSASALSEAMPEGSEAEFITEHYWGYTKLSGEQTSEYGVGHPRWETYPVNSYHIDVDFEVNYGKNFSFLSKTEPNSVMLAEGSEIFVKKGGRINQIR